MNVKKSFITIWFMVTCNHSCLAFHIHLNHNEVITRSIVSRRTMVSQDYSRRNMIEERANFGLNNEERRFVLNSKTTRLSAHSGGLSMSVNDAPNGSDTSQGGLIDDTDKDPIYKNPYVQVILCGIIYLFHLLVLTQHEMVFPWQLFPDINGRFQSIGLDSVAGILSFISMAYLSKKNSGKSFPSRVPSPFSNPSKDELPWKLKKGSGRREAVAGSLLLVVYFLTGIIGEFIDEILYVAKERGLGMSIAMHRSLQVLFGHLSWVFIGSTIIRKNIGPFFSKENDWYKNKWNTFWLGWVMGGYFVSAWFFNIADFINQIVLPSSFFDAAGDGVVAQLINPENNDMLASAVGYIAPCLTAPWWEEILYRGFMLPALTRVLPAWLSVFVSGFIFSIHHVSTIGFIPLWVLGALWAALYMKCNNLFVTIIIHALWNSRIFIGSWFGI